MPYVCFGFFHTAVVDLFADSDRISQRGCFTSALWFWSSPFSVNASCLGAALSHVLPWCLEWLYQSTPLKFRCKSCLNWEDRWEASSLSLPNSLTCCCCSPLPTRLILALFFLYPKQQEEEQVRPWSPICTSLLFPPQPPNKVLLLCLDHQQCRNLMFWVRDSV